MIKDAWSGEDTNVTTCGSFVQNCEMDASEMVHTTHIFSIHIMQYPLRNDIMVMQRWWINSQQWGHFLVYQIFISGHIIQGVNPFPQKRQGVPLFGVAHHTHQWLSIAGLRFHGSSSLIVSYPTSWKMIHRRY